MADWLEVTEGEAPLIVAFPHTGTEIDPQIEARLASPWLARKDADWRIEQLYDFAGDLGATTIRTRISRTVIDVNRDPSGASLYPGQAVTELCPTTTFDGEPLYRPGAEPDATEIAERRTRWFAPYYTALEAQIRRLRARHPAVVLYDAHAIRSRIPRLFEGELPHFNIGTNSGASCAAELAGAVFEACDAEGFSRILDGRFKGGWTTRRYGQPADGVHAVQMELACRAYLDEPESPLSDDAWPAPWDGARAEPCRTVLRRVLASCLQFAEGEA
ncbi:N-formylglutamate deformylase [Phenylobacterium sp. LjRoot225]|uniref:N-formylglutamate deformylase n=1 Tax=Phenylobacterium sp. LjRoot225 TaxID=3342285 RepID=UPI003ECD4FC4